ncbi:hypothetical protein BFJ63_vAg17313 [Fusarium oxysporum f. sp. narcissi]|nr:hypothetical protein BFJ63_vAg17313 [Fusarium oxysporum f. sp. narcissi]
MPGAGNGSESTSPPLRKPTIAGVVIGIFGFGLQFTGLRLMNWSATLAQFIGMVVMTVVRVWIRRDLADRPVAQEVPTDHEIDWLALQMAERGSEIWTETKKPHAAWVLRNMDISTSKKAEDACKALRVRVRLDQLSEWRGPSAKMVDVVSDAIESVMNSLGPLVSFSGNDRDSFTWSMARVLTNERKGPPSTGKSEPMAEAATIIFTIRRSEGRWKVDIEKIRAALSLWHYSASHPKGWGDRNEHIRLLGRAKRASRRDIYWWGGSMAVEPLKLLHISDENVNGTYVLGFNQQPEDQPTKSPSFDRLEHEVIHGKDLYC